MFLTWDAVSTGNEGPVCQQSLVDNKSYLRVVMVPPERRDTTLRIGSMRQCGARPYDGHLHPFLTGGIIS